MQTIQNQTTQADYTAALTLGPLNFAGISASVWNATCWYQVYSLGGKGDYQLGDWGEEIAVAPSTLTVQNCGGIRFRTNPNTPASPALVNAWGWQDGEPIILGGLQLSGTLAATGAYTAGGNVITGIIPATGTTPTAGTGFTYTHTNGTGVYVFTFATAFSAAPDIQATLAGKVGGEQGVLYLSAVSASGFTVNIETQVSARDIAFTFAATPVV